MHFAAQGSGRAAVAAGVADAGLASLATFAAGLFAVRALEPRALGAYALVFTAFNLLAVVPAQLLFVPAETAAAGFPRGERGGLAAHSLRAGLPAAALAAVALPAWMLAAPPGIPRGAALALTGTAAACTLLSPVQDHLRRMLHVAGRSGDAARVSAVQLAVVVATVLAAPRSGAGDAWIPFGALAAANALSLAAGLAMIRGDAPPRRPREPMGSCPSGNSRFRDSAGAQSLLGRVRPRNRTANARANSSVDDEMPSFRMRTNSPLENREARLRGPWPRPRRVPGRPFRADNAKGAPPELEAAALARAGRWLLLAGAIGPASGFAAAAVAGWLAGPEALGFAEAARVIGHPVLVLAIGLSAVLGPRSVRAARARSRGEARRVAVHFQALTLGGGMIYLAAASHDWALNPFPALVPRAYAAGGLAAAAILAAMANGALFPSRSELLGARRAGSIARADAVGAALRVGIAGTAGATGVFAVPLGFLALGLARWAGYRRALRSVYDAEGERAGVREGEGGRARDGAGTQVGIGPGMGVATGVG